MRLLQHRELLCTECMLQLDETNLVSVTWLSLHVATALEAVNAASARRAPEAPRARALLGSSLSESPSSGMSSSRVICAYEPLQQACANQDTNSPKVRQKSA